MNFQAKNFIYTTKPLSLFLEQIDNGSQQYLRSLSAEKPSEKPAQFAADFPELAADFVLPPQLEMVAENAHSSPLRISGPVNMWLHYDVSLWQVQFVSQDRGDSTGNAKRQINLRGQSKAAISSTLPLTFRGLQP